MSTATKLVGFLVGLSAVFAAALGVGRAIGPLETSTADHPDSRHGDMVAEDDTRATPQLPKGLLVSQDGYTLRLAEVTARAGDAVPVPFQILGPDGDPVTDYDVVHEEDLHLIAVQRDFTGFQHVHPELLPDGTWTTALDLTPGQWRLFADFRATGGEALTLGADLAVPGRYQAPPPPAETRTAEVDGFTVMLDGDLTAGAQAELRLTVTRDGRPVTDLEPYLGSYGHLVALREGDLAYLHVHPEGSPDDGLTKAGPDIVFLAEVPSAGGYRLYLDFKHEGVVRTAAFTVPGTGVAGEGSEGSEGSPDHDDPGHDDAGHDDAGHDDAGHDE